MLTASRVFDDLRRQRHPIWMGELHSETSFLVLNPIGTDCKDFTILHNLEPLSQPKHCFFLSPLPEASFAALPQDHLRPSPPGRAPAFLLCVDILTKLVQAQRLCCDIATNSGRCKSIAPLGLVSCNGQLSRSHASLHRQSRASEFIRLEHLRSQPPESFAMVLLDLSSRQCQNASHAQ